MAEMEDEKPLIDIEIPDRVDLVIIDGKVQEPPAFWGGIEASPDATPVRPKPDSIEVYDPRPKWEREN